MNQDIDQMLEAVENDILPAAPEVMAPLPDQRPLSASTPMFEDDEMLGLCAEILTNMRSDRKQIDTLIANFVEMVFNEGNSQPATKEALVGLVNTKAGMSDKMMGIVKLMASFKLKEMTTTAGPKSVTASQENHYHFSGTRRSFLEQLEKRMKAKKDKEKKTNE
jgi:hypothetical protein